MNMENINNQKSGESLKPPFEIKEGKEAKAFIENLYAQGDRPIVTVPKQYIDSLKQGLRPYATWIGLPLIAATFGREPYVPNGEERVLVQVEIPVDKIKPRFTGPNKTFSGVVVLEPPIPPDAITYSA
jgi:hypothetical protein